MNQFWTVRDCHTVFWNDCTDSYGGVLVGIRSNLESQLLYIHPTLEIYTVISVYLTGNKYVIVICIYRAPTTDLECFNDLCIVLLLLPLESTQMPLSIVRETSTYLVKWINNNL